LSKSVAVMGCGWLGLPAASKLVQDGHSVYGSTTTKKKLEVLKGKGIIPFEICLFEKEIKGNISDFLNNADVIIINIPPQLRSGKGENYVTKIQLLHEQIKKSSVEKVIFVSSTSVYGNIEGEVTEETKPQPITESGKQLLVAEALFKNDPELKTTILRFGGLIGPDRHPIYMLAGRKELKNGNAPVNLIHLNDCISIISQTLNENWWHETINGVNPEHPTKKEYYTSKAKKLNLEPPVYELNMAKGGKTIIPHFLESIKKYQFNTAI